jgi:hypothetical protein
LCPVILKRQDQALNGLGIKLLHVGFARETSEFIKSRTVYPLHGR